MPLLSRAETQFLRRHLNQVCHVTLDPAGPGVVRIHLVPNRHRVWEVPFVRHPQRAGHSAAARVVGDLAGQLHRGAARA